MKNYISLFIILYFLSVFHVNIVKHPLNSLDFGQDINVIYYKIKPGDTLWNIAGEFYPSNKENFINEVMIMNNLDSYLLEINKILVIPLNI
tara:strand:+ start:193 stop:465 length:273 start_codon:yes stop_codon:yes gene_type:complete